MDTEKRYSVKHAIPSLRSMDAEAKDEFKGEVGAAL